MMGGPFAHFQIAQFKHSIFVNSLQLRAWRHNYGYNEMPTIVDYLIFLYIVRHNERIKALGELKAKQILIQRCA
jgi:hypothetical protein